jgi:hypothetical protein
MRKTFAGPSCHEYFILPSQAHVCPGPIYFLFVIFWFYFFFFFFSFPHSISNYHNNSIFSRHSRFSVKAVSLLNGKELESSSAHAYALPNNALKVPRFHEVNQHFFHYRVSSAVCRCRSCCLTNLSLTNFTQCL